MTLHEFIILMTLPIGTSRYNEIQMILPIGTSGYNLRYTSEYIPKLQIHQYKIYQISLEKYSPPLSDLRHKYTFQIYFFSCLELFKFLKGFRLILQKIHPHSSRIIIYKS